jgi:hypothetical protein
MNDNKELFKRKFGQVEQTGDDMIPGFDIFSLYNSANITPGYSDFLSKLVLANFLSAKELLDFVRSNMNFQFSFLLSKYI